MGARDGGRRRRGRRLLLLLAALTAVALVVDLSRPELLDPLRRASAAVLTPAQSALAGLGEDPAAAELRRERDELAARVARLEEQQSEDDAAARLRASASWARHPLLPARVVGFGPVGAPGGGSTVTLDVGEADGVRADQTVVAADGLVGRVLRTSARSSDVLLLGEPGVVVAVRVGPGGRLGSVRPAPASGLAPRDPGRLALTVLGSQPLVPGEEVTTLGSPDHVPYVAGVPLGTVLSVDDPGARQERTAIVAPHVDRTTLDHVLVVLVEGP